MGEADQRDLHKLAELLKQQEPNQVLLERLMERLCAYIAACLVTQAEQAPNTPRWTSLEQDVQALRSQLAIVAQDYAKHFGLGSQARK